MLVAAQESQMYSSRPMAGGLETQEELMFQFKSEVAKKVPTQCFSSSSNSVRQEEFPLIQDRFNFFVLHLIGGVPSTLRRTI